jgi:WD40 repeat protein
LAVAVTPDGRRAISGSIDGTLKLWDLSGRNKVSTMSHEGEILALAISSDGSRAVTGSGDRTIRVWDLKNREVFCVMALDAAIVSLAASADATIILVRDTLQNISCLSRTLDPRTRN